VTDTGVGMDEWVQTHLFEPFFTTKEPGKGTGLGLATVYGIVKQSEGHIEVVSDVGRGTSFKVYLPQPAEVNGPERMPAATPPPAEGGKETILLVEDEEAVRTLTERTLKSKDYRVLTACNGMEALAVFKKHRGKIDLVVSDVVMPMLSGTALIEQLRLGQPQLKALLISGYNDSVLCKHGVTGAATNYLHKPFSLDELIRSVRETLDSKVCTV
jgi:CheY-like chemotaxis protein